MPNLPNPYQPANSFGAGLDNIAKGIFGVGRLGMRGGYGRGRPRSAEQNALDEANTAHAQSETRKTDLEGDLIHKSLEQLMPEQLNKYGALEAGLPLNEYSNIKAQPPEGFHAPLAAAGYNPEQLARGRAGQIAEAMFARSKDPNPDSFAKAAGTRTDTRNLDSLVSGIYDQNKVDQMGAAYAATGGKPLYGTSGGQDYGNFKAGSTPNAQGLAKIDESVAGTDLKNQQRLTSASTAGLNSQKLESEKFKTRINENKVLAPPKVVKPLQIGKEVKGVFENQFLRRLGVDNLENVDLEFSADVMSDATRRYVTPGNPAYGNPNQAIDDAMDMIAPNKTGTDPAEDTWYGGTGKIRPNPRKRNPSATTEDSKGVPTSTSSSKMDAANPANGDEYDQLKARLFPNG